ncbi:MAG: hypothetical protein J7L23_00680 [Candidatus Diapherotrites archaeon]|nr:hypothetical protein [Candidatus Diapherotrites archaeon]
MLGITTMETRVAWFVIALLLEKLQDQASYKNSGLILIRSKEDKILD